MKLKQALKTFCSKLLGIIPSASRDNTDIFDVLRLWRDNSTNRYYGAVLVISEFH